MLYNDALTYMSVHHVTSLNAAAKIPEASPQLREAMRMVHGKLRDVQRAFERLETPSTPFPIVFNDRSAIVAQRQAKSNRPSFFRR